MTYPAKAFSDPDPLGPEHIDDTEDARERHSPIESGSTCRYVLGTYRCQSAAQYTCWPQRIAPERAEPVTSCIAHLGPVLEQSGVAPHHWQVIPL